MDDVSLEYVKKLPTDIINIIKNMVDLEKFLQNIKKKVGNIFDIHSIKYVENSMKLAESTKSRNFEIASMSVGMGHYIALAGNIKKEGYFIVHLGGSNGYDYDCNKKMFTDDIQKLYSIDNVYTVYKRQNPHIVEMIVMPREQ